MAYRGIHIPYPLGQGGFNGSRNIASILPGQLYEAKQIRFKDNTLKTAPGLTLLDSNGVSNANATLCAGYEWSPTTSTNRQITVWSDGKVYKETSDNLDAVELANGVTVSSPFSFVEGGQEDGTGNRKLFMFTSNVCPKILTGDGSSFTDIASANYPSDWNNNFPSFGLYHDYRVYAFSPPSNPHTVYCSFIDDHGKFEDSNATPQPPIFRVEPGVGLKCSAAISDITQGSNQVFVFKYPKGIFSFNSTDVVSSYIPLRQISLDVGCCGPNAVCQVENDILFIGQNGHIYSLSAVQTAQNVNQADLTARLNLTDWIDQYVSQNLSYLQFARLVYNKRRREVWALFRSSYSTSYLSVGFVVDISDMGNPKISVEDRGSYYEGLWTGYRSGEETIYCGGNGNSIYYEDELSYKVGSSTKYTSKFEIPETDFEWFNPQLRNCMKRFDWLEIEYIPQLAETPINITVYIDGSQIRTVSDTLTATEGSKIGDSSTPIGSFTIGGGRRTQRVNVRIGGYGRRLGISLRTNTVSTGFEIERFTFGLKAIGHQGEI